MAQECHPVWKQFALRRFGRGDAANELFRRFPPTHRDEFGRYGIYSFSAGPPGGIPFTRVSVVTKDGRLIAAGSGSCTWRFTFFNAQDPELERQYEALLRERYRSHEQRRLEQLKARLRAFYRQRERWPTNEAEFAWFVTGEKPPVPPAEPKTAAQKKYLARYGLRKAARFTNPLGISLKLREDGAIVVMLHEEPDFVGAVEKPAQ